MPGPARGRTRTPRWRRCHGAGPRESSRPAGGALAAARTVPCVFPGGWGGGCVTFRLPVARRRDVTARRVRDGGWRGSGRSAAARAPGAMEAAAAAAPAASSGALVPAAAAGTAVTTGKEVTPPAPRRTKKILDEEAYIEVGRGRGAQSPAGRAGSPRSPGTGAKRLPAQPGGTAARAWGRGSSGAAPTAPVVSVLPPARPRLGAPVGPASLPVSGVPWPWADPALRGVPARPHSGLSVCRA